LLPLKKKAVGLTEAGKIHLSYKQIREAVGSETKMLITENGDIVEIYWDDTYSSSTFPAFAHYIKAKVTNYLGNERRSLGNYLVFCDLSKYESYQESDTTFVINVLEYLAETKAQRKLSNYISKEIVNSDIMREIEALEQDIAMTEAMNAAITSFEK
jgi:hypothetical protein